MFAPTATVMWFITGGMGGITGGMGGITGGMGGITGGMGGITGGMGGITGGMGGITGVGADTEVCPYVTDIFNDEMHVVGHYYAGITFDIGKFIWQFKIPFFDHLPGGIQNHFVIYDFSEIMIAVMGANGDIINTGL